MAKVVMHDPECFNVRLTRVEKETVKRHADRESLTMDESVADLLEHSIITIGQLMEQEEEETIHSLPDSSLTILLHIAYPTEGPLSSFNGMEKRMIASMLLDALELGVHIVRHTHRQGESIHGMERQNEGVGASVPTIPIDGRGNDNVRGSGGPCVTQG